MSTSLLYHGVGVRGYYTRTDYLEGEAVFTIEQERDRQIVCRELHSRLGQNSDQ